MTPKLLSVCRNRVKVLEKLLHLLNRDESNVFHRDDIFKTASKILEQLSDNKEDVISERQIQAAATENPSNNFCYFHGYLLKRDLETSMEVR